MDRIRGDQYQREQELQQRPNPEDYEGPLSQVIETLSTYRVDTRDGSLASVLSAAAGQFELMAQALGVPVTDEILFTYKEIDNYQKRIENLEAAVNGDLPEVYGEVTKQKLLNQIRRDVSELNLNCIMAYASGVINLWQRTRQDTPNIDEIAEALTLDESGNPSLLVIRLSNLDRAQPQEVFYALDIIGPIWNQLSKDFENYRKAARWGILRDIFSKVTLEFQSYIKFGQIESARKTLEQLDNFVYGPFAGIWEQEQAYFSTLSPVQMSQEEGIRYNLRHEFEKYVSNFFDCALSSRYLYAKYSISDKDGDDPRIIVDMAQIAETRDIDVKSVEDIYKELMEVEEPHRNHFLGYFGRTLEKVGIYMEKQLGPEPQIPKALQGYETVIRQMREEYD
jgi:hypothetical protein